MTLTFVAAGEALSIIIKTLAAVAFGGILGFVSH